MSVEAELAPDAVRHLREAFHDMRQPVATVLALAAAALTEPDLPAAARGRLEQIVGQAGWLADLMHACLAANGQEEPHPIETVAEGRADVVHVVSEAIAAECLTWPGDVTLTSPAGPVWCMLHPVLLRRVVSNVLGNAARAAGPSGTVTVEIRRRKGAVLLTVQDNGPGFGMITSGTGLGLSAVARIVVKYGGSMQCGGGARGGARVSLWLPLIESAGGAGPVRLVLCDDNRILCEALAVALEARGHQVLATATTATLGIAEVATRRPDACLLDIAFPDPPDGLTAARVIRQRYPGTAVLLLSGLADPAVIAEATQIGVAGFLRKDHSVDHIARTLDVISAGGLAFDTVPAHAARPAGTRHYPGRDLTSREREVLRRIAAGQSTKQMSREMNVAASTLRSYVKTMLAKLGTHTRLEAAVLAVRENLLGDQTA
ncbi:MAG TPA: ATP-binding protein [Streptosporangiaceae bacterium]|nr:ATP-binding protein [Streptosporangiaceae bacterium]